MRQWLLGRWGFLTIGAVLGLIVGVGLGLADRPQATPTSGDAAREASPVEEETPEVEPEPEAVALPDPEDIEIGIRILEKQCFGSAGCNITFRIDPSFVGSASVPEDVTIEVIYEVHGGEDGPQINTFTITGGTAEFDAEEFISTSSSSAKLSVGATEVLEG